MISNERQWPSRRPPQRKPYFEQPYNRPEPMFRPPVQEDTLARRELQIERKRFLIMLQENPRGRVLRIAEETNGRSNSIIIPATGLADFQKVLQEMVSVAAGIPAKETDHPAEEPIA